MKTTEHIQHVTGLDSAYNRAKSLKPYSNMGISAGLVVDMHDEILALRKRVEELEQHNKELAATKVMVAGYGCDVVVDLSKLEHLPEVSCYNNNWYKSHDVFIFVKCLEEYNQVNIYISDKINGDKVFLISDHYNHEGIYSGEVGFEWV